jgi:hypothetical protein
MADHTETISSEMNYAEHEATWSVFTKMVKWGIIGCAVMLVALYLIVQP